MDGFTATVSNEAALEELANSPDVQSITLDPRVTSHLASSVQDVGAHFLNAIGVNGSGVRIAILDSGIDASHPNLTSSLIAEECFLDFDGVVNGIGLCPNMTERQSGPGAAIDFAGHGTHVSGIIAGDGVIGAPGVAPGAKILSFKVLDGDPTEGATGFLSDSLAALDYIAANPSLGISIVNMSLGSLEVYTDSSCELDNAVLEAMFNVIELLAANGITVLASAGNDGLNGAVAPACFSNTISVGAYGDSQLADYSNRGPLVDFAGPGNYIISSGPAGGTISKRGTSMAVAHASGMAALLIELGKAPTPGALKSYFLGSPRTVSDPIAATTYPRTLIYDTDADGDSIVDYVEAEGCTGFLDADSDDDGLGDEAEDLNANNNLEVGETNPCEFDSDQDGLGDGLEVSHLGMVADPDGDGPRSGTDRESLPYDSDPSSSTNPLDADSDDDGLLDGTEDINSDGFVGPGETDPNNADTDGDGVQDGTELGNIGSHSRAIPLLGTDQTVFVRDNDPDTTTNPLLIDTDGDGVTDGEEDLNADGAIGYGERNPGSLFDGGFDKPVVIPGSAVQFAEDQGAVIDVNGDGLPDIVGFDGGTTLTIFENTGSLLTLSSTTITTLFKPTAIEAGDINGDEIDDLIVAHEEDQKVTVLLGSSAGLVPAGQVISLTHSPRLLLTADLNGDNRADVITADIANNFAYVHISDGLGGVLAQVSIPLPDKPRVLASGDVDGDDIAELIVGTQLEMVAVLEEFSPTGEGAVDILTVPNRLDWVAVTEASGDDIADIVGGNLFTGEIYVLVGQTDGSWLSPEIVADIQARFVAVEDLDLDGITDVVVSTSFENIKLLFGLPNGGYGPPIEIVVPETDGQILLAPVFGEHYPDIVIISNGLSVVRALGAGTFETTSHQRTPFTNLYDVASADLNDDNRPDLLFAAESAEAIGIHVRLATGDARFEESIISEIHSEAHASARWTHLAIGEISGNGATDAGLASRYGGAVAMTQGDGTGAFSVTHIGENSAEMDGILVADVTADGMDDIVVSPHFDENASPSVYLNQGGGSFSTGMLLDGVDTGGRAAAADVNGDGIMDLLFPYRPGGVQISLGSAAGTFSAPVTTITSSVNAYAVAAADILGSNAIDVVLGLGSAGVQVLEGVGDGTFGSPKEYRSGASAKQIELVDMNQDGLLDLVVSRRQQEIGILIANVDGSFQNPMEVRFEEGAVSIALADFNRDTFPDVAAIDGVRSLSVVLNRFLPDPDGDGVETPFEENTCMSPGDSDSDDDGLSDGNEQSIGTDPCVWDSDKDGLSDGVEVGVVTGIEDPDASGPLTASDPSKFAADLDPSTVTNPLLADYDGDGFVDGLEDLNANGRVDEGETDPLDPASFPAPVTTSIPMMPPVFLIVLGVLILSFVNGGRVFPSKPVN